jgi:hypothetical protein
MKVFFTNLPTRVWIVLGLPLLAIAYPIFTVVVPAVIRQVVPETVRTVLHLL